VVASSTLPGKGDSDAVGEEGIMGKFVEQPKI
jgi:hypothetical protein